MTCSVCGCTIHGRPFQRVVGWQTSGSLRPGGSRGGSDIHARRTVDEYACALCVERERNGVSPGQLSLSTGTADRGGHAVSVLSHSSGAGNPLSPPPLAPDTFGDAA